MASINNLLTSSNNSSSTKFKPSSLSSSSYSYKRQTTPTREESVGSDSDDDIIIIENDRVDVEGTQLNSERMSSSAVISKGRNDERIMKPASNFAPSASAFNSTIIKASTSVAKILPPPSSRSRSTSSSTSNTIFSIPRSSQTSKIIAPPASGRHRNSASTSIGSISTFAPMSIDESEIATPKPIRTTHYRSRYTESTTAPSSTKRSLESTSSPPPTIRKRPASSTTTASFYQLNRSNSSNSSTIPRYTEIDWTKCDPQALSSTLLRSEYLIHGNLTRNQSVQSTSMGKRNRFVNGRHETRTEKSKASWIGEIEIGALVDRLDREEFTATCWARDLTGVLLVEVHTPLETQMAARGVIKDNMQLRKEFVDGVELLVLGLEFPLKLAIIIGTIVSVRERCLPNSETRDWIDYSIDDSTAVIVVSCKLSAQAPLSLVLQRAVAEGTLKYPPSSSIVSERLECGTLVRVVGEITEGPYAGAPRQLSASKIEVLDDLNVEVRHHLSVARLHQEVYSKRLDVATILSKIILNERTEEKDWKGSQVTESVIGTPKKTKKPPRLPHPRTVGDFTLDIFIAYILEHLNRHHMSSPLFFATPASSPAKSATKPGMGMEMGFGDDDEEEEDCEANLPPLPPPLQFDLSQLEGSKSLRLCAELSAQRKARDALNNKKKGVIHRPPMKQYVNQSIGIGSMLRAGTNQGVAKILGPPRTITANRGDASTSSFNGNTSFGSTSTSTSSTSRLAISTKVEGPLEGDGLLKEMSRQFKSAILKMCKQGQIIVNDKEPLALSLPTTINRNAASKKFGLTWNAAPQSAMMEFIMDGDEDDILGDLPRKKSKDGGDEPTPKKKTKPSCRMSFSDSEDDAPVVEQKIQVVKKRLTRDQIVAPWEEDSTDDETVTQVEAKKRKKEPKAEKRAIKGSSSIKSSPYRPRSNPPPRSFDDDSVSMSGESSTDLMTGDAQESYQVVTAELLCPLVLALIQAELSRPWKPELERAAINGNQWNTKKTVVAPVEFSRPRGVSEETIRSGLAKVGRLRAVYARSTCVVAAVDLLVDRGYLVRSGTLVKLLK